MTARPKEFDEVGQNVVRNIEELRKARGLSLTSLSARLAELGRPIGDTVLHRQAHGGRRIDTGDLVAFASVFDVDPARLLADPATAEAEDHPAVRAARTLASDLARLAADPSPQARIRADRTLRRLEIETEELLAPLEEP